MEDRIATAATHLKTPSKLLLNQWATDQLRNLLLNQLRNLLTQCKEWVLSASPPAIRLSPLTYVETFSLGKECTSLLLGRLGSVVLGCYKSLCVSIFITGAHYWIQEQSESLPLCPLLKYDVLSGVETADVFKKSQE